MTRFKTKEWVLGEGVSCRWVADRVVVCYIIQRRERAKKKAKMTHKDRVAQYNAALDRLRSVGAHGRSLPQATNVLHTIIASITICQG